MWIGATPANARHGEDQLSSLPHRFLAEYRRGQVIFDEQHPSQGLYRVVRGRVRVGLRMHDGAHSILDIYAPGQFFGECGLLEAPEARQYAIAMESAAVMHWTRGEIAEEVERRPALGAAIGRLLAQRCQELKDRLQSLAIDKTQDRLIRAFLHFAKQGGTHAADGAVRIPPLTQQLVSQYIGTSREIVTFQMNRLRDLGLIRYSRKGIDLYTEALMEQLNRNGTAATAAAGYRTSSA
jgi:CRP/FNR family cyclic AMP-dependent transcriptional regulator